MNVGYLVMGFIFAFLAAIFAYMISYEEYRHHYPVGNQAARMSLWAAFYAFLIFAIITILIILVMPAIFKTQT
jgi:ferric iron reductase protein FhuF